MAAKKSADHTLYHLTPKGFWKKFRDMVVVNPEISSGLPLADVHRRPQPGSRPERYSTPSTMASDIAQNPYWKRDVRRVYPQTSVITQEDFSKILIASPQAQSITAPDSTSSSVPVPAANLEGAPLSDVIGAIYAGQTVYSPEKLPPVPPTTPAKQWVPTRSPDAPHAPYAYWPMKLYK
ncbi:hypothetical protein M408DRAFT_328033 [Serendipita vermifera MAFF 305830]|uniref:NUZM, NADH-ubiquinone oxidoreductase 21.3 kDa subunit n=1 Tax=Serendipita vermifera MAFF 305830 TaxID=933852 RepID=A0A0C3B0Z1_SERVB|nr:hypothetical protein M408DRAFT_328033 [Serendipita vermifera MAFF 305830]